MCTVKFRIGKQGEFGLGRGRGGSKKSNNIFFGARSHKVCRPKTNSFLKPTLCTTCIHLEAPNASKCMHVVHSVGVRKLLVLGRHTILGVGFAGTE